MSRFSDIHFLHPAWLLALPPLLALLAWLTRPGQRDGAWSRIVDPHLLPLLRLTEQRRGNSPWVLIGLLWTLAILALASPTWERQQTPAFRIPAAWVLVLDLSPSMAAADVTPDRVTRARYALSDLMSAARDARVGLVVFAGEPHVVAPLTTDVATVRVLLQPLAPNLMPETGDRLAPALGQAEELLHAAEREHGKVIVLTDGFADPAESINAAHRLRQHGATVDVIGVGTSSGAPEPDGKGGFVRDVQGRTMVSRVPADSLERVADAGGGRFVPLSDAKELIPTLQAEDSRTLDSGTNAADVRFSTWRNDGVWLLPPLLVLAAMLARRGWL